MSDRLEWKVECGCGEELVVTSDEEKARKLMEGDSGPHGPRRLYSRLIGDWLPENATPTASDRAWREGRQSPAERGDENSAIRRAIELGPDEGFDLPSGREVDRAD